MRLSVNSFNRVIANFAIKDLNRCNAEFFWRVRNLQAT
ncbi:hypothetical protein CAMGR0001_1577 [Campylobacter gracilis RM3268]|uniref:Uncharacterized protein n=1 Tax=Campylobacter gracilis RM3268 TaxID=553220 RepID=C8PK26_9BACT|nr:hypothetical protein CAMGR0001_1577 [Campylobacter gracilis RM3268]